MKIKIYALGKVITMCELLSCESIEGSTSIDYTYATEGAKKLNYFKLVLQNGKEKILATDGKVESYDEPVTEVLQNTWEIK